MASSERSGPVQPAVKRLALKDVGEVRRLIQQYGEDLEPGFEIQTANVLIGAAPIDLVARDSAGSLVLVVVDRIADDALFLRALEATAWCREHPEVIQRLLVTLGADTDGFVRVVLITEHFPEAFLRKVALLDVSRVDCFTVRHLQFQDASSLYLEHLVLPYRDGEAQEGAEHVCRVTHVSSDTPPTRSVTLARLLNGLPALPDAGRLGGESPDLAEWEEWLRHAARRPRQERRPGAGAP